MSRPRPLPTTALAAAISDRSKGARLVHRKSGAVVQDARFLDLARLIGCDLTTLSRINRGSVPNAATAEKLASWLGWTAEEVMAAARTVIPKEAP